MNLVDLIMIVLNIIRIILPALLVIKEYRNLAEVIKNDE